MIIRSKAPLRLGLAGGGTDVSPFADQYGGAILNATINLFAYATIEPRDDKKIVLNAIDKGETYSFELSDHLELDGNLDLLKGVYNRIVRDFKISPAGFTLTTFVEAPPGSGLGSSSTLVVTIIGAFKEWYNLPLGEYDVAHLAFEIERLDLKMAGGRQDQYAATFGGFNFMEFYADDKVIVNPLRIKNSEINELEFNLLLYNTETSRLSSTIIEKQQESVNQKKEKSIDAMKTLKEQAVVMKEAILTNKLDRIGQILDFSWQNKKQMAAGISNPEIDLIYSTALASGASGGKISGAGGGGFMFFYCPGNSKYEVIKALKPFGGIATNFQFTPTGLFTWKA